MKGMSRLLRRGVAKALVAVLLVIQVLPMAQACPFSGTNVSMAFAAGAMPEQCAGMSKQACLLNYVQADQAWSEDHASIAAYTPAAIRIAPVYAGTLAPRGSDPTDFAARSGEPPPRVLFCRLLE